MKELAQVLHLPFGEGDDTVPITGPAGFIAGETLGDVISRIIPYVYVFAGIGLLLMLISGGFSLLTAASDPKKLDSGKQRITYAIVGFFIVILSYWGVQLIALIFGLEEFRYMFGPSR